MKLYPHQSEALKDIRGYEGLYAVDRTGNIFSKQTSTGRRQGLVKPWNNGSGYLKVNLYKDGAAKKYYVHRLVADAFLPNPDGLSEVNHRNGDKHNNSADNLEWCSRIQNIEHSFNTHLQPRAYSVEVETSSGVRQSFRSMRQASQTLFGNVHAIKVAYAKAGKSEFSYNDYRIKVVMQYVND